ncbi:MAG: SDR family NAD(P)-dependent oxidoreductase [Sphingobium phenoxybenzoativorans]
MELEGKTCLITGGGSGIGAATAMLLAKRGVHVVVSGRRADTLNAVAAAIRNDGGKASVHQADFSVEKEAEAVVLAIADTHGQLNFAVNAAGAAAVGTAVDSDEALFARVIDANLKTAWLGMKYQIPAIAAAGGGAIVNLSSVAGLGGTPHGSIYSAAKHAVIGLTKSAALEFAAQNVRINVVCPGTTRTEQFDGIVRQVMGEISPDEAAITMGKKYPLGRIAQPEDIAGAIAWLLSPDAAFMTGSTIVVDGGKRAE